MVSNALLTDLYQLTMAQAYLEQGRGNDTAAFELYFRRNPFHGGYAIAAGLETAVRSVIETKFEREDIEHLRSMRSSSGAALFSEDFLRYISKHRFRGNMRGIAEGTVVFPNEPILRVSGELVDCQLAESILLCHVNYQTLIATKASRLWQASRQGTIVEFGLRRAHGPDGAVSACRAAYIGGVEATSNVLGSALFGLPAKGTHAHSWVQAFPTELEAFRAYARSFPNDCTLLVDTYDVLGSGVPNAIKVGCELQANSQKLFGIRIDSGDLAFLSRMARQMLDRAGLGYVKIVASNDLDEYLIADILAQGGRIDLWGVGTKLVTASGEGGGSLGGVYKIVIHNGEPKIKLSSNPDKMTSPGLKRIVRFKDENNLMQGDALAQDAEVLGDEGVVIVDPVYPLRRTRLDARQREDLLADVVIEGKLVREFPPLVTACSRRRDQLECLHESYRRLRNAHEYKVGLTEKLWRQKELMLNREIP